jgi:hypothetical protein
MPLYRVVITQHWVRDHVVEAGDEDEANAIAENSIYGPDWEGVLDDHDIEVVEIEDTADNRQEADLTAQEYELLE